MTVNYIVVGFLGKRRMSHGIKPEEHFKRHLDSLRNMNAPVDRVTVVVNADGPEHIKLAARTLKPYKKYYTELKIVIRHNVGHSYGGWNDTVNACIRDGHEFDKYFLIEDDYVPVVPNFVDPFEKAWTPNTGYVCQMVSNTNGQRHAAASSGLLMNHIAKESYDRNGSVFNTIRSVEYKNAQYNQIHFLDFITQMGYEINDCMKYAALAWADKNPAKRSYRVLLGTGEPVLEPLVYPKS